MSKLRNGIVVLSLAAASLPAADFFPLETGNEWVYRESGAGAQFQIRVGAPALIGGQVYYTVHGYGVEPLLVRRGADGALYARDEERDGEVLLTSFRGEQGDWFRAPYRTCEQEGQAQERPANYQGPAGRFASTLRVRYRTLGCADAGVEEELYAENLGMLTRVVSTFAGPRTAHLIYARVGKFTLIADDGVTFDLALSPVAGPDPKLRATMRLAVRGSTPHQLVFPSSQEYEITLKNADGLVLWRWSDGRVFTPAVRTVELGPGTRLINEDAPLPVQPGIYTVEAWITAGESRRELAASARFEVADR
jgi:hypothetical protein